MRNYFCAIVFLWCTVSAYSQQFEIELSGNIEFNNLQLSVTEAGLNFSSSIESTADVRLSVRDKDSLGKKNNPNKKWTLSIRKEDQIQDDVIIQVVRTGKGTSVGSNGNPNIHGGSVFQTINSTNNYFCHGMGEIADIPLRFKLDGLSVLAGVGNHQMDITITVDEGWK